LKARQDLRTLAGTEKLEGTKKEKRNRKESLKEKEKKTLFGIDKPNG
jgi:hypothetical protein